MLRLRGVGKVYDAWASTHAAEVPVRFEFTKMTDEEAQQIAGWRYVPPYDFYDSVSDPDDLAELLDPHRRGDDYFSAFDKKGARGPLPVQEGRKGRGGRSEAATGTNRQGPGPWFLGSRA
jgi:hypothetical protein